MHRHSIGSCIILKRRVNDPGLAFIGKVGLGPFWTLVQVLSYVNVLQLTLSSLVSSFRLERIATVRKIYTRMHMQDSIGGFHLTNYETTYDNHEVYGWPLLP
jgi:hypothetical protein